MISLTQKKLMIRTTLSEYKDNYQKDLDSFLKEYEDSTESIYLQFEHERYHNHLTALLNYNDSAKRIFYKTWQQNQENQELEKLGINLENSKNHIISTQRIIEFILGKIESTINIDKSDQKTNKTKQIDEIWFNVGILFADGTMKKYYDELADGKIKFKNNFSARRVAIDLKNSKYEKNILATIQNYSPTNSNGRKNIFNSKVKMQKIIEYCEQNSITVIPYFRSRIPLE